MSLLSPRRRPRGDGVARDDPERCGDAGIERTKGHSGDRHSNCRCGDPSTKPFRGVSTFVAGIFVGLLMGRTEPLFFSLEGGANETPPLSMVTSGSSSAKAGGSEGGGGCKLCDEDKYRHVRSPVQFLGPLSAGWLEQYDSCLPVPMRYKFSLNGTIGVSGRRPSQEGNPRSMEATSAGPDQIYGPLSTSRKHLFGRRKDGAYVWSKELLDYLIGEVAGGKDISCKDYPQSATDVQFALKMLSVGASDRLLVGGSISPWVEAVALHLGVGHVTTVDYSVPHCDGCHERLETIHMMDLMDARTPAGYSHIVSYSSIEHDGLGRYGDPLNHQGDLEAMREFWSLLRPGGILLLAIPLWAEDRVEQLLARLYGPIRLSWLLGDLEWDYLGTVNRGVWSEQVPFSLHDWGWHPIIALRKSPGKNGRCNINCKNSEEERNAFGNQPSCRPSPGCRDLSSNWPLLPKDLITSGNGRFRWVNLGNATVQ